MKVRINVSIERDIVDQAQEQLKGNISSICEKALKEALGNKIIAKDEEKFCYFCGKHRDFMLWSADVNMWICDICNKAAINQVAVSSKWLGK